jgi:hypothetical protein
VHRAGSCGKRYAGGYNACSNCDRRSNCHSDGDFSIAIKTDWTWFQARELVDICYGKYRYASFR